MDDDWATEVLEWWIANAPLARQFDDLDGGIRVWDEYGFAGTSAMDALRARQHVTQGVVSKIVGTEAVNLLPLLNFASSESAIDIMKGVELCKYSLGRLRGEVELREHLGSSAPTMAADALHPTIWDAASKLWDNGHYGQAVSRAATLLNAHVQDLTGRTDLSDGNLMRQVFSTDPPSEGNPRLRWPGDNNDQTVKSMRQGTLYFSQGIFAGIHNPATHGVDDVPRQEGLEQLAALSVLARWIDGCQVVR